MNMSHIASQQFRMRKASRTVADYRLRGRFGAGTVSPLSIELIGTVQTASSSNLLAGKTQGFDFFEFLARDFVPATGESSSEAVELSTNEAILAFAKDVSISSRGLLVRKLGQLIAACKEDDQLPPSGNSIEGFRQFLRTYSVTVMPALSVTEEGHLYARWKRDADSLFSILVKDQVSVSFVLFAPATVGDPLRQSATVKVSELGSKVSIRSIPWVFESDATAEPNESPSGLETATDVVVDDRTFV